MALKYIFMLHFDKAKTNSLYSNIKKRFQDVGVMEIEMIVDEYLDKRSHLPAIISNLYNTLRLQPLKIGYGK